MSIWLPTEASTYSACWSSSTAVHQQALLGSAHNFGGEDDALWSHYVRSSGNFGIRLLSHGRFLHKNPEDPLEVPGGFLSDLNPVSSGSSWGYGLGDLLHPVLRHPLPCTPYLSWGKALLCLGGKRSWGEQACGEDRRVRVLAELSPLPGLPACGAQCPGRQLCPLCPTL